MCFYVSIVKSTEGKTSGSPKILISSSNHSLQLLQPGTNMLAFIITPKTVHTWNEEKFNMGGHLHKDLVFCSFPCLPFFFIPETSPWALTLTRGGSRGRVQGVRTPRTWDDLRFSNTTGILQKKLCGLLVLKQSKRRVHPLLKKILDPPLLTEPVPEAFELPAFDWPENFFSGQSPKISCWVTLVFSYTT